MAAGLMMVGCGGGKAPVIEPTTTEGWEILDALVDEGIKQEVYPGAVLIIGQPDKVIWAKAYGTKTYDEGADPMELDSVFDLASISKIMGTTTAALLLLEDETIKLTDPVSLYIPQFGKNGKEGITILDLMTHVSGLQPYENYKTIEKSRKPDESQADAMIRWYSDLKPRYKLRKELKYSCLNFQTLARVVENASGERMEDLLQERVWEPMGMTDTEYTLTDDQKVRAVPTMKKSDGSLLVAKVHDPLASYYGFEEHCPGNAGLFSTPIDAAKFCEMILNKGEFYGEKIYDKKIIEMATASQTPRIVKNMRGLGWGIYESEPYMTPLNTKSDKFCIGHTGYTGTLLWLDKRTKTYIVFFTNRVYPDDKSQPEGHLTITGVRKSICNAVLRTTPEYDKYFAEEALK